MSALTLQVIITALVDHRTRKRRTTQMQESCVKKGTISFFSKKVPFHYQLRHFETIFPTNICDSATSGCLLSATSREQT
jgi:hypothetical protein